MLIGIDASRAVLQRRTGTEAYAYFLIRSLIELSATKSHRLRLYFNQPPQVDLFPDLAQVERVVIPFPRLWTHLRLAKELQQKPPSVFFTPAHVIPFVYRGASVATVHDLGYHLFPEAHTKSQAAYLNLSTRTNSRLSKRIIADSMATKDDLIRFYGTNSGKIDVIYPGIDPALVRVTDPDLIAETCLKYGVRRPYLLHIGTIQPRKNLFRLVAAFAQADLPHQLVLSGKPGWQSKALFGQVASMDKVLRDRIVFPGYIAEGDKAALLSGADAMVFPSLYEGFGFPVLEAQAVGIPVMVANSSSLPEIAAESALLVEPLDIDDMADGLRRITQDSVLRKKLIQKGDKNIRRFDWQKTAAAVLRVLEDAASS